MSDRLAIQVQQSSTAGAGLQLSPIRVNPEYCKKWNIHEEDFVCLTLNGELLRPTLYRIGGINNPKVGVDRYFMLIKHVEAFYSEDIVRASKERGFGNGDPKHLEGRWVILDKNGVEKVEFSAFNHGYMVSDSCIYSIEGKYYNIETGEHYCNATTSMQSSEFLFLHNSYDKDKSRRGVMKINKQDGSWELFKEK